MFYYNTYQKHKLKKQLMEIFNGPFNVRTNVKYGKIYIPILILGSDIGIFFHDDKIPKGIEKDIHTFVIKKNEPIEKIINRLLTTLLR
nr:MAG: hypothetical protein DiTV3a_F3ORF3 [Diabrotica toursvirus 3a]